VLSVCPCPPSLAGGILLRKVFRDRDGMMGVVDYTNIDDIKYAVRKLDDSEFKNPFDRCFIRVKADKHSVLNRGGRGGRSRSRSRSKSRSRSRSKSRSRSRSKSRSRSRSRSRSPRGRSASKSRSRSRSKSKSRSRSRSRSRSPVRDDAPEDVKDKSEGVKEEDMKDAAADKPAED